MLVQPTLFDGDEPSAPGPLRPQRHHLDDESWIDHQAGWLTGTTQVFDDLYRVVHWHQGTRLLFDNEMIEPRLSGSFRRPDDHPWIERVATSLSDHYGVEFDTVFLNLYRSGDDAVAWHRDRIHRRQGRPLVAIVTLGTGRRFLIRPYGGGSSRRFCPHPGDLLVMGGRSQHDWEHCVPRSARVHTPRISVTLRPSVE